MSDGLERVGDPVTELGRWLEEAAGAGLRLPDAVALATTGADGMPDVRYVLVKGITEGGCEFYTNNASAKAAQLRDNPKAALAFYWRELNRQARVRGTVREMERGRVAEYFATRPRDSQVSAWASRQSAPLASREEFLDRVAEVEGRFEGSDVPLPDHWSGYVVDPLEIEFWVEGKGRMHGRSAYRREAPGAVWSHERLYP